MWYITRHYIRLTFSTWGPVLALMMALFVASAQPKFGPPGEAVTMEVYLSGAIPVFPGFWETLIKKGSHVIVYGALGVMSIRALLRWGMSPKKAVYLAVTVSVCFALSDELHQAFVPGRHASGLDIGLDFIGAAFFTIVAGHRYAEKPEHPAPKTYQARHPKRFRVPERPSSPAT